MPANFQLGLLPERRTNWRTLAISYGLEAVAVVLLLSAGLFFPQELQLNQKYTVTEIIPMPDLQPPPPPVQAPQPVTKLVAPPPVLPLPDAKLFVPKDVQPKPKEKEVEAPKLEAKFTPPVLAQEKTLPARAVYTGTFGSSAPATVAAPIQQVQTGGFGDPNGLKGEGKQGAHLVAAQVGSFDLPSGPGNGNGTGGAKGIAGAVASAGFGSGIAQGVDPKPTRLVAQSGFGSQVVARPAAQQQTIAGPATTPVQITSKPRPVYTDEARALKIEGEVLLEVLFGANGQLHVNRVVQGLGHGLDEAAIAAANKMQFKPALASGSPVDSTAIVHVVFQLAY
ncbi:MAG TPA: energy transducer TonB [Terriglobales bacterium]